MPLEKFREPTREPTSKLEKEKEKSLIRILVIEDNPEYIKDFEELEKKIKKLDLPIIFEKARNMKEFREKSKEGFSGALVDVFVPEDEKNLGMIEEFEKILKWKIRTSRISWKKGYLKEYEENNPTYLLRKFLSETDKEKKKEILKELKEFFSIISGLKIGEKTVGEELKDIPEEEEFQFLIKCSHLLCEKISEEDIQKEIDKKLIENTPGIKMVEELEKKEIPVPSVIVTSLGHHGIKISHIFGYAEEKNIPVIETYRGDEESKKDWKRGLLTLIKEVIIPKRKKENLDYSDLEDIAKKIESIEEG